MNRKQKLFAALTFLFAAPTMAHVGPENASSHFIEHMLIILVVGLPAGYALLRHLSKHRDH